MQIAPTKVEITSNSFKDLSLLNLDKKESFILYIKPLSKDNKVPFAVFNARKESESNYKICHTYHKDSPGIEFSLSKHKLTDNIIKIVKDMKKYVPLNTKFLVCITKSTL